MSHIGKGIALYKPIRHIFVDCKMRKVDKQECIRRKVSSSINREGTEGLCLLTTNPLSSSLDLISWKSPCEMMHVTKIGRQSAVSQYHSHVLRPIFPPPISRRPGLCSRAHSFTLATSKSRSKLHSTGPLQISTS